jgi:hypothetical protein
MKQGIIQLQGVDGEDLAIFEFDQNKTDSNSATKQIELQLLACQDEDNPLDAAEEKLEALGISRIYIAGYANTSVV